MFLLHLNTSVTPILSIKHEIEINIFLFSLFNNPHRRSTQTHTLPSHIDLRVHCDCITLKNVIYQNPVSIFHPSLSLGDPGIAGKSPIHFINGYKLLRCKEAWFIGAFLSSMCIEFTATSLALNIAIINLLVNISFLLLLLFLPRIFPGLKLLGDMACTFNFDECS